MLNTNAPSGILRWLRKNLFSSTFDAVLTILAIYIIIVVVPPIFEWALLNSVWLADSRIRVGSKWPRQGLAPAGPLLPKELICLFTAFTQSTFIGGSI